MARGRKTARNRATEEARAAAAATGILPVILEPEDAPLPRAM
jgi:hypothetical protein